MLDIKGLCAGYGGFQALFDVSLSVKAGEAIAVIGPNGAGKTTLLRAISRLIDASAGDIVMEGRRYNELPAHEVVSLGIAQVPEGRRLFPRLTVEDNLMMGAFTPAARKHYRDRQMAGTMSGGEQQMCAIGRALMSKPKLLLLDEPSAGLAPVIVQSIFELMKRIRAEGYTVLIVEQNIQQVLQVVDRGYLLETGRIRMSGPSAELLASDEIRKAYLGV